MENIVLKVKPQELVNSANKFSEKADQVRKKTNEMLSLVTSISNAAWAGEGSRSYKKQFAKLNGDMSRMFNSIKGYVRILHDVAGNYDQAERTNIASVGKLENDVIK